MGIIEQPVAAGQYVAGHSSGNPIPTAAELLERTRALLPSIRARAAQAHLDCRIPDETMAELKAAGLFRVVQPARYGGYEMNPNVLYDIQMALGEACVSTGWVYGLLAVHNFQLALFDDRAQAEVWGSDPDTLVSSTYQPVGKVTRVDGGFRLTGRWRFSSGSQHCDWIFLGSLTPSPEAGGPPIMTTFLLPRPDYQVIEDTWDVFGMRGTGSLDIVVADAFIPEYRTHTMAEGFHIVDQKGLQVNHAPLFRMPWGQQFARVVATSQIGGLTGALEAFLGIATKRVSSANFQAMTADPHAAAVATRVRSDIEEMRSTLHRTFDSMMEHLETTGTIPIDDRLRYRYEAATIARRCAAAADTMMAVLGSSGLYTSSPFFPFWRDLMASRAHFANNPDALAVTLGGHYLGVPSPEMFC